MDTVEGRSRLVHEARPLLQKIAAPAMQLQLLKQVAELSGMETAEAMHLCGIRLGSTARVTPGVNPIRLDAGGAFQLRQRDVLPQSAHREKAMLLAEYANPRKLLQCLIAKPGLAEELPMDSLEEGLPEVRALAALAALLREYPEASASFIIGQFQGGEHEGSIRDAVLSLEKTGLDATNMEAEFRGILARFELEQVNARISELSNKAERSAEEKEELQRLFQELNTLKNQPNSVPPVA